MEYSKLDWKTLRSRYSWRKNTLIRFHITSLFLYSVKISDNQKSSDIFRWYRKKPAAWNYFRKSGDEWVNFLLVYWQRQPFTDVLENNVLTNFMIFKGKHLCQIFCSLWRPATLSTDSDKGVFLRILWNF